MSKFITAVSMACTQEQYEQDLRKPLLEMGYKEEIFDNLSSYPVLVNNVNGDKGKISDVSISSKNDQNRYFIDHYNPKLYLALAAMTNETYGIKGEWWVYIQGSYGDFTHGMLYQGLDSIDVLFSFLDNKGERNGYAENPLRCFRKATKREIISHLTNKKSWKERSKRIIKKIF